MHLFLFSGWNILKIICLLPQLSSWNRQNHLFIGLGMASNVFEIEWKTIDHNNNFVFITITIILKHMFWFNSQLNSIQVILPSAIRLAQLIGIFIKHLPLIPNVWLVIISEEDYDTQTHCSLYGETEDLGESHGSTATSHIHRLSYDGKFNITFILIVRPTILQQLTYIRRKLYIFFSTWLIGLHLAIKRGILYHIAMTLAANF